MASKWTNLVSLNFLNRVIKHYVFVDINYICTYYMYVFFGKNVENIICKVNYGGYSEFLSLYVPYLIAIVILGQILET